MLPISYPRGVTQIWRAQGSIGFQRCWRRYQSDAKSVLAIETSCDDTSVSIVSYRQRLDNTFALRTVFHKRITANNDAYQGIHPIVALESHRANLAPLIQESLADPEVLRCLEATNGGRPTFVAATRGPGMRSNLAVGLDTGKALSVAWKVPFLGVHHMQAHALTPRLMHASQNHGTLSETLWTSHEPEFPFLTVLASGGHTMLIESKNLTTHSILAETQDIALGDFLDKSARNILPPEHLKAPFGRALEKFAFPDVSGNGGDYGYVAPARRQEELERRKTVWGWSLAPPLSESNGREKTSKRMVYSFAGLQSYIERMVYSKSNIIVQDSDLGMDIDERRLLAREAQRVSFEHLASRIVLHLKSAPDWQGNTIVVSGGVASNKFLRHVLRQFLDARGYSDITLSFPPIELCTDNALMIAWTGIEMYEAGHRSSLDVGPIRKWSLDPQAPDGGIMGVGGWHTVAKKAV
nr:trna n6-adenosine threonylcarbamoyltransferase, mitochondrial [Quercus suber]